MQPPNFPNFLHSFTHTYFSSCLTPSCCFTFHFFSAYTLNVVEAFRSLSLSQPPSAHDATVPGGNPSSSPFSRFEPTALQLLQTISQAILRVKGPTSPLKQHIESTVCFIYNDVFFILFLYRNTIMSHTTQMLQ
jgi:hypothetical protein